MFHEHMNKLAQVERFDRVVNTKNIHFGAVDSPTGQPRLTLRLPSSEVVTLEERAQAQLGLQWAVPPAHLERLPIELAIEELKHFATHALALPNLDPDEGKLQRQVVGILRRENLATQAFLDEAGKALREGERTLFELIQFVSDNARLSSARLADRVHRERVAGRLMALAA